MRKYIVGAIAGALATVTLLVGGVALAAVTVVLTGPATYADLQWESVSFSNKNGNPNYRANITVCPSSSNPLVPGACSTTEISVASLPAPAQTIVNYMITNVWCPAHPGYCS
jgi:hypothetical protein